MFAGHGVAGPLLEYYAQLGPVDLPDLGNGIWIDDAASVLGQAEAGNYPRRLTGTVDDEVTVFATDGGGGMYAVSHSTGCIYRLAHGALLASVYQVDQAGYSPTAPSLRAFLAQLRSSLTEAVEVQREHLGGVRAGEQNAGMTTGQQKDIRAALPVFRYHPDPVATGAITASGEPCVCCGRRTGWIYTATFYTAQDVAGRVCPWCIADGGVAERFEASFLSGDGLDDVAPEVLDEVTRRTPGFSAWQDPRWMTHCHDAAAFLGEVGYNDLAARPEALEQLRQDLRLDGGWRDERRLEAFLIHLGNGGASAMLFRCLHCGHHLAYTDAS